MKAKHNIQQNKCEEIQKEDKMNFKTLECPKCGSTNIGQFLEPTGPIWCTNCLFRIENKEIENAFIKHLYTEEQIFDAKQKLRDELRETMRKMNSAVYELLENLKEIENAKK